MEQFQCDFWMLLKLIFEVNVFSQSTPPGSTSYIECILTKLLNLEGSSVTHARRDIVEVGPHKRLLERDDSTQSDG